jgi:hypothetical protein
MEHPACRYVDSTNFMQFGRGSSHPSFVKEVTPFGTFLGQVMTVYEKELADRVESKALTGLSPGYKTDTNQIGESDWEQFNRRGNHNAVVASPRGGPDVGPVLAGLRSDSEEELIWVCDSDDVFASGHSDWVSDILKSGRIDHGLLEKTTVNLDRQFKVDAKPMKSKTACTACAETGKGCDCDKCKKKKEGKMPEEITLDSIQERIDSAFAEAEEKRRTDAAWDGLNTEIAELKAQNAALSEENEAQAELLEEAAQAFDEFATDADDEEEEDEEVNEDEIVFDSIEDFADTVAEAVTDYMKMRSDSALLGVDMVEAFGGEKESIKGFLTTVQDLKRQIIQKLNPSVRIDSIDNDEYLDALYEMAMEPLRQQAAQPKEQQRTDSSSNWAQALQTVGTIASPAATKKARPDWSTAFDKNGAA